MLPISCAVGPNFKKPAAPEVKNYSRKPLHNPRATVGVKGGESQRFVEGLDIPAQWWTMFHSKPLNALVESSLRANPSLKAAQDALLVARENVSAQVGAFYPSISGGFLASRQKSSASLSPVTSGTTLLFDLYTSQVSVSYVPDVFGLDRRTLESLKAQAEQQRFALEATYLTLSSNVVAAAIQEAALRGQIAATQLKAAYDAERAAKVSLDLTSQQLQIGYANALTLLIEEQTYQQA